MNIINKQYKLLELKKPYPVWIIDNFLNKETLDKIHKEWPDKDDSNWHGGHEMIDGEKNILEQGMLSYDIKDTKGFMKEFLEFIHSEDFTNSVSEITGIKDLIGDDSMRWSGIRTMLPGSFQAIHSDARLNPETGLRKELTCLIYFNDWKRNDNGCFEVWNDDMTKCTNSFAPINNRMVIFLNTDKSYHGVPEVSAERKSITWSILKKGDVGKRSKALFVSRPQDDKKIGELGEKRAYIQDAK